MSGMGMDAPMAIPTGSCVNEGLFWEHINPFNVAAWPSCTYRGTDVTLWLPRSVSRASHRPDWPREPKCNSDGIHEWVYDFKEVYDPRSF